MGKPWNKKNRKVKIKRPPDFCGYSGCMSRCQAKFECRRCEKKGKEFATSGCKLHVDWASSAIKTHTFTKHPGTFFAGIVAALKGENVFS